MDIILVVSNEPALAETLASELPDLSIEQSRLETPRAQRTSLRLIVADEGSDETALAADQTESKVPIIKLIRPVRLSALLYTIREKLQSKTTPERDELPLGPDWRLATGERLLKAQQGSVRIPLTGKECELLICLLKQRDNPAGREALLQQVWGYGMGVTTHTLETHIYRLRGKLRQANAAFDIVFLEEGGYRLHL